MPRRRECGDLPGRASEAGGRVDPVAAGHWRPRSAPRWTPKSGPQDLKRCADCRCRGESGSPGNGIAAPAVRLIVCGPARVALPTRGAGRRRSRAAVDRVEVGRRREAAAAAWHAEPVVRYLCSTRSIWAVAGLSRLLDHTRCPSRSSTVCRIFTGARLLPYRNPGAPPQCGPVQVRPGGIDTAGTVPYQPVVKVPLHSTGHASRLTVLFLAHILSSMLARLALSAGRLTGLGATRDFHHGLVHWPHVGPGQSGVDDV